MPDTPSGNGAIDHIHINGDTPVSPKVRQHAPSLAAALNNRFIVAEVEVEAWKKEHELNEEELLACLIEPASTLARPPISNYHVGAVGIGLTGKLYVGVNIEFPKLPLFHSIHAEQCLLVNALTHGEHGLRRLAVSAAPCGHCRQFYSELACAGELEFYFKGESHTLDQLLPMRFKPSDLLPDPSVPLLMQPQSHRLKIVSADSTDFGILNSPVGAAAAAKAETCYSPYSKCPSGVAFKTKDGCIYSGGYIESAAFNPSMAPLQAAFVDAVVNKIPSYQDIEEVVLIELKDAKVKHEETVRNFFTQLVPEAKVMVVHFDMEL